MFESILNQAACGGPDRVCGSRPSSSTRRPTRRWLLADGFALIGRRDDALRWLREAVARGFINYPKLSRHDPFLESIRGDAEFEALMQQVKQRWQALSA